MDLWHGSLSEFVRSAAVRALAGDMTGRFVNAHRYPPSASEVASWDHSLAALADALRPIGKYDLGVMVTANSAGPSALSLRDAGPDPTGVALEYHLPFSGKRIDVIITGLSEGGCDTAVVLELKQWDKVALEDEHATNILLGPTEHLHPSQQALDYAAWLSDYHSAFSEGGVLAQPAAYCHEIVAPNDAPLRDPRFQDLIQASPLFTGHRSPDLSEFVNAHVGRGGGLEILRHVIGAKFKPSKRVLDSIEAVLELREEWHLLGEQRIAFNAILDEVRRQQAQAGHAAILVRGAPGTGKTVIAVQLLAAALRNRWGAAHSTGGKAFTTTLKSKFGKAADLFVWNMSLRNARTHALDLLLVDEAHRVRETSDMRFTPRAERGRRTQTEELINAAKVTVFLLDENQFVRPDEVGSSDRIRSEARNRRAKIREYDLQTQFRCGGCAEYVAWVDWLLGYATELPLPWGDRYEVMLVDSPESLAEVIGQSKRSGKSARLVAGFCWKWSNPGASGELVPDVVIGDWRRPWNRKAKNRPYKPAEHPYTKWAETSEGELQVGCIYSAQGFEFDRIGVIWGSDLVWRTDRWIAQKAESRDSPVRSSSKMLTLVRNAYRVLLTRGLEGAHLLILDGETREYVRESLAQLQQRPSLPDA